MKNDHYYSENPKTQAKFGIIHACLKNKSFEFTTASSVFSVKRVDPGTRILVDNMVLPKNGRILDIGCGYGVLGIVAAKLNPKLQVILTDVNRRAVLLARQNAEKNRASNVEVRQGNLYDPVQNYCFDCILSNPPVSAGMETVEAIIKGAPQVMTSNATFQMVVRSKIGKKTLPEAFEKSFGNFKVLAIESGYRVLIGEKIQ